MILSIKKLITFSIFFLLSFIFTKEASAQPIPSPTPIPCEETRFPEFHTYRPYQASPCNRDAEDLALFCGNDLILQDPNIITKTYHLDYFLNGAPIEPGGVCQYDTDCQSGAVCYSARCTPGCVDNGDGTDTCTFTIDKTKQIAIELTEAELPIMGNTECVRNSINTNEWCVTDVYDAYDAYGKPITGEIRLDFTDPLKVNEYVSWYLNGVTNNPQEYAALNPDNPDDIYKVINLSGVLRKLLSHRSQREAITKTIQDALSTKGGATDTRHDQVVGCIYNLLNPITRWGKIVECYHPRSLLKSPVRLSDWQGRLPPKEEDYATFSDWWAAYRSWRGLACINLLGVNICIENPLDPNYWGNLFFHIPFSSTEDRVGEVEITNYTVFPQFSTTTRIIFATLTGDLTSRLNFAHMQEDTELAKILQKTFAFKGADLTGDPDPDIVSTSPQGLCDLRAVRSNPGDNLFADEIRATLNYQANATCTFFNGNSQNEAWCNSIGGTCQSLPYTNWTCSNYYPRLDCPDGEFCGTSCSFRPADCLEEGEMCERGGAIILGECCPFLSCTNENFLGDVFCERTSSPEISDPPDQVCPAGVTISLQTVTKTPLADEVWSRLVAGPAGVFKKIFPKVEVEKGRPVERLWDIPAATKVVFRSLDGTPIYAGSLGRPGGEAELYFPHIGGIHEYFLKCIQKTLRPQGFGEGCVSGPEPLVLTFGSGSCASPPPAGFAATGGGTCSLGSGLCSPSYLSGWWSGCRAKQASIICNGESGGNPSAMNCSCLSGGTDYSIGLFQINLLSHTAPGLACYQGFDWSWGRACTIIDQGLVDACTDYYLDAENNIQKAYSMSSGGTNWSRWSVYNACRSQVDSQCP